MPALAELEAAWVEAWADAAFRAELAGLLRDFAGRPTPLYAARRLSERAGRPIWLKREDLNHTGSHKLNNALGQALLATRMGKPRIIAETGAGQHGVAAATACALLGLECVVYMGEEDIRRQAAQRAADASCWARASSRRRRRAHAQGGDLGRDPRLGRERRDHPLHHRQRRRPGALSRCSCASSSGRSATRRARSSSSARAASRRA